MILDAQVDRSETFSGNVSKMDSNVFTTRNLNGLENNKLPET